MRHIILVLKSVFVTKFSCASLAAKPLAVKLLNSVVLIYLSWLWLVTFFLVSLILYYSLFSWLNY